MTTQHALECEESPIQCNIIRPIETRGKSKKIGDRDRAQQRDGAQ